MEMPLTHFCSTGLFTSGILSSQFSQGKTKHNVMRWMPIHCPPQGAQSHTFTFLPWGVWRRWIIQWAILETKQNKTQKYHFYIEKCFKNQYIKVRICLIHTFFSHCFNKSVLFYICQALYLTIQEMKIVHSSDLIINNKTHNYYCCCYYSYYYYLNDKIFLSLYHLISTIVLYIGEVDKYVI